MATRVLTTKHAISHRDAFDASGGSAGVLMLKLSQDLPKLLSESGRRIAVTRMLDQPLEVGLELVVLLAVGAPFEMELEL
jgi:hypothetical protein